MLENLMKSLTRSENAALTISYLLVGVVLLILCSIVTMKILKPIVACYNLSKQLEKIAKNEKPHWFYGHIGFVSLFFVWNH